MNIRFLFAAFVVFIFSQNETFAQDNSADKPPSLQTGSSSEESSGLKPNGRRIRRQLNLIVGMWHDEEFLIPNRETVLQGRTDFFKIQRIEGTDYFRILPLKSGSGIATLNDKKTGQILVEIRFDIRDDSVERTLREIQALLVDIEGIEFKLINPAGGTSPPMILIDGYVLLPKDLIRISHVISNYDPARVRSLVTLSPIARQKIADFITRDVNNPEVKISAVGNFIKLEGQVNNEEEHRRIKNIVKLYLPDIVTEKMPSLGPDAVQVQGRKPPVQDDDLIYDLITIRPAEDKVEPPPKLIQVVTHFVQFNDDYGKTFNFNFSPALSAQGGTNNQGQANPSNTFESTINLLNNLLPKLQYARFHGFAKVLDTASILVQDGASGSIDRQVTVTQQVVSPEGNVTPATVNAAVKLSVTPAIKSERSGLIELKPLTVTVGSNNNQASTINVNTTISVRDRQSAAFGGILKKASNSKYGAPTDDNAIITLKAFKEYTRDNSQFVVFVTPIIKSSASTGVEQVKKKFRLRD